MIWPFRRKTRTKGPVSRLRLFLWPFVICLLAAIANFTSPIEDAFRGLRDTIRARPADKSVVVVAIDDRTVQRFKTSYYSRQHNADLLDKAFAGGAKRVYFDESFRLPLDPEGDQSFASALTRHYGRVFIGADSYQNMSGEEVRLVPIDAFRSKAPLRSFANLKSPFQLTLRLGYGGKIEGQTVPSISGDMAGRAAQLDDWYRPDWSIQASTIPTISLADVIDGKIPQNFFKNKDVLLGVTAQTENDFTQIVGQGWVAGVYGHAIGAQTLREGSPTSAGGLPILLVAAMLSIALLRTSSRRRAMQIVLFGLSLALVVPFILDSLLVDAYYVPAILLFGVIAYRANNLRDVAEARRQNANTLLPNLSALREEPAAASRPIVAMRIRNYAAVCASFPEAVEADLITELARRLTLPGEKTTFYQAEDVLYWLGPKLPDDEIAGHLAGLAQLIESHLIIQGRKLDIHVVFGVDTVLARPVASRIGRALLAADQAAAKHQLVQFNNSENDDESAWELSLMSELDAAIDNGDIWVAFQPQFNLKTDRIVGAEALVRWLHPTRGAISPEAFVLAAEEYNRITRLTFYVLEQSIQSTRHLVAANPTFRLSVNISAVLLENPQLPQQILLTLAKYGFPASSLTLEVTESAPFAEHTIVAANLEAIAALGIELSIDDYGTGNATLDYLRSVPCQEIKIDRRFVANLVANPSDMLLVESTIELAHGLGRRVIAEGIEDPETLELLRAIHCDIAQGYYLAKPMRIEALEALLNSNNRLHAA
ncbi:EAL domain-containing protein [Novosphingobium sp.]|uniref:EAL domain-containing protein n=1 Tax=Novosphingobium sp. TaxID=1874826 RepID=UPI0025D793D4|nr:EAL domain-containing protein [Novosphingobium sp.]MCC6924273.1 EAL domain-containing protein [Novosphingobium sp.]